MIEGIGCRCAESHDAGRADQQSYRLSRPEQSAPDLPLRAERGPESGDSLNGSGLGTRSWSSASRIHVGAAQLRLRPTAYPLALRAQRGAAAVRRRAERAPIVRAKRVGAVKAPSE